ncbi:SAP domain-containing protein [Lentzea cavernae]|uniref:SAP domain-containing protein n=1 Tax=Lentzea cavernae TaxID=2020703 RepID=A0ABQ3N0Y4_9PSEU|nr:SAP domain-containing protein [Lentzea cavernae]GHH57738.1 hypothetical protein GCM10017774_77840 [Lentzea cavernae]
MPKITVHGGPSIAGQQPEQPTPAAKAEPVTTEEIAAERVILHEGDVVVPRDATRVADEAAGSETPDGPFEPLPEAIDGDGTERVSNPDYPEWTVKQLREELGNRGLSKTGNHDELVERLQQHDVDTADEVER